MNGDLIARPSSSAMNSELDSGRRLATGAHSDALCCRRHVLCWRRLCGMDTTIIIEVGSIDAPHWSKGFKPKFASMQDVTMRISYNNLPSYIS